MPPIRPAFEHRLKVECRTADDLEHVGGRGLLLQRFAQFIEQARILDGDDGLGGKILHQLDLLIGERPHLLAIDADHTNKLVLLEHWYVKNTSGACAFDHCNDCGVTVPISLFF